MEHAGPRYDQTDHQIKPDPLAKLRESILERLLRFKNIDLNSSINDGLHDDYFLVRAVGAPELAKLLVAAGESVEPPKYSLLWRWLTNYEGILSIEGYRFLLEQGANPKRDSQIICALARGRSDHPERVQVLNLITKYGVDAKFIDAAECGFFESWGPAITVATYYHFTKVVAAFLKLGVNPKLKARNGKTALDIAKAKKFQDLVELLERSGG